MYSTILGQWRDTGRIGLRPTTEFLAASYESEASKSQQIGTAPYRQHYGCSTTAGSWQASLVASACQAHQGTAIATPVHLRSVRHP